jgi:hypothetical protein
VLALHGLPSVERVRTCIPIPTQKETQSLVLYVNLCDGGHPDAFPSGFRDYPSRLRDHGLRRYSHVTVHLAFPANAQRTRTGIGSLNRQSIFPLESRVDSFTVVLHPRGVRDPEREPFDDAMTALCPYPIDWCKVFAIVGAEALDPGLGDLPPAKLADELAVWSTRLARMWGRDVILRPVANWAAGAHPLDVEMPRGMSQEAALRRTDHWKNGAFVI